MYQCLFGTGFDPSLQLTGQTSSGHIIPRCAPGLRRGFSMASPENRRIESPSLPYLPVLVLADGIAGTILSYVRTLVGTQITVLVPELPLPSQSAHEPVTTDTKPPFQLIMGTFLRQVDVDIATEYILYRPAPVKLSIVIGSTTFNTCIIYQLPGTTR